MEIANIKSTTHAKEERSMNEHKAEHFAHGHRHPVPPHERKGMISIQFDERDWGGYLRMHSAMKMRRTRPLVSSTEHRLRFRSWLRSYLHRLRRR